MSVPMKRSEGRAERRADPPKVWAVLCYREGENAQILALAEALGWPFEVKRLAYRKLGSLGDALRWTSLLGIDRRRSSPLVPPWPDLIISAAMRNEPVCRWVQRQAGKRVRYVHIGRPWARLRNFDLVVTVPEYRLPERPNVLQNELSLTRVTEARLAEAATVWSPRLAHLPRPYVAVLVGGYGGPYALGPEAAWRLGREVSAMAGRRGGSVLVTTSRRTAPAAIEALQAAIDVPAHLFRWRPDASENPYYGYLALADSFIVTCDSATMLAEACATGKPVYMFDPGPGEEEVARSSRAVLAERSAVRGAIRCDVDRVKALLYRQLLRIPPRRLTRDVRLVHRLLISSGRAAWLGQSFPADHRPPPVEDTRRAVDRVRALFDLDSAADQY